MNLKDLLLQRIALSGPMTVAEYMAECLLHPTLGYYTNRDPFGSDGDFVTAPEVSQMFGELVGLSLAQAWLDQGAPAPFTLAELGPGRGTLMADILRATRNVPGFHAAARITLLEASPKLRERQAQSLKAHHCTWIDAVDHLPDAPLYLIANEFFDALPIRQFVRDADGWRERMVGEEHGTLAWGLGAKQRQPSLAHRLEDTRDGDLIEWAPAAGPIVETFSMRIKTHGGAALIFDYGDWRSLGDTFQALRSHKPVDALDDPGKADLTAHLDFEALASAAKCPYSRLTPQGIFLERLGITTRAQALAKDQPETQQNSIATAHRRLTHPEEMGRLFKVLGLYPEGATPPPGLEP